MIDKKPEASMMDSAKTVRNLIEMAVRQAKLTAASGQNLLRWLSEPYYIADRERLMELINKAAFDELNSLFWERIPFGTGGRRGPMSDFGSATINARTIAESACGLAVYVQQFAAAKSVNDPAQMRSKEVQSPHPESLSPQSRGERTASTIAFGHLEQAPSRRLRAVVARDTRHRSTEFARLTAMILAAHGFEVYFFTDPRATPELSFAVRHLHCDTGVMISASHNPPSDNGFKAYWNNGGQVLPPHDAGIIACVDAAEQIPTVDFDAAVKNGDIVLLNSTNDPSSVDQAYIDAVCSLSLSKSRGIKALYTPMHGVGESSIYRVLKQAGFRHVELYEPQRSQDGSFPNVPDHLPNPERPQALRPAIDFAQSHGHSLVLASDPDADRLAIAVRDDGDQFVCLTGNQLGALLADYILSKRADAGSLSPEHFLVETLVTTPLLEAIGHAYGVHVIRDLLVGFKYIAAAVDANGPDKFVFAAEESVGYLAGEYCRDKDACVAALFGLELASELQLRGQTLVHRLDELYVRHGYYHETQFVQVCPGPQGSAEIANMMAALREKPPIRLGSAVFDIARDYKSHEVRSLPSNTLQTQIVQPSGDLLIFEGKSGPCQISLAGRPSGTEPKIKFYLFARSAPEVPLAEAKQRVQRCLAELESGLKQWLASSVG